MKKFVPTSPALGVPVRIPPVLTFNQAGPLSLLKVSVPPFESVTARPDGDDRIIVRGELRRQIRLQRGNLRRREGVVGDLNIIQLPAEQRVGKLAFAKVVQGRGKTGRIDGETAG